MSGPTRKPAPVLPAHGLLSIAVQAHDDVTVISLRGELDSGSADMLRAYLSVIPRTESARVVADLADLAFIDSSGLAVLVGHRKRTQGHGGSFALAAPQAAIRRLLTTTGLLSWFEVHDTVAEALSGARPVTEQLLAMLSANFTSAMTAVAGPPPHRPRPMVEDHGPFPVVTPFPILGALPRRMVERSPLRSGGIDRHRETK